MLEIRNGLYGSYIYRDGEYFDTIIFNHNGTILGESGILYNPADLMEA